MPGQGNDKRFSFSRSADQSIVAQVRFVGDDNAAGTAATAATVQSVTGSDRLDFFINASKEGMNTYTGAGGAAGELIYTEANCSSIQEVINNINGVGTGQPAIGVAGYNARWRAAPGDMPPLFELTALDVLNAGATNVLLGHRSPGYALLMDASAMFGGTNAEQLYVGIGNEGGVIKGSGLVVPDYFEDLPGETGITGFSSNVADRSKQTIKQNDDSVIVAQYSVVIDYIWCGAAFAGNDLAISVFRADQIPASATPIWTQVIGAANATLLDGTGRFEVVGPRGMPLHVLADGTGAFTDGPLVVSGHYESSLRR